MWLSRQVSLMLFFSSSTASRLLSDPCRTKLLSYFNWQESCLFLCGNQATRLLSWESTTATKKTPPSKVDDSSYSLVNKEPGMKSPLSSWQKMRVQLLKNSVNVIFKNSRLGRKRREEKRRLIGQSLSVEVCDFD